VPSTSGDTALTNEFLLVRGRYNISAPTAVDRADAGPAVPMSDSEAAAAEAAHQPLPAQTFFVPEPFSKPACKVVRLLVLNNHGPRMRAHILILRVLGNPSMGIGLEGAVEGAHKFLTCFIASPWRHQNSSPRGNI